MDVPSRPYGRPGDIGAVIHDHPRRGVRSTNRLADLQNQAEQITSDNSLARTCTIPAPAPAAAAAVSTVCRSVPDVTT
ncbi:hypothetical protein JCM18909_2560 [Cutibacterium acnes JCM 18909]|nr:hypothetical protein JCM18909_2560 [Cutibacterium acnes JCM 18909]